MNLFPRRADWLLLGFFVWAIWMSWRACQPRQVFQDTRTIYVTLQALDGSQVSFLAKQLRPNFPKPK